MAASEIVLDLKCGEVFEWGSLLATVTTFPEKDPPASLMESCFRSLCSCAIRGRVAANPALVNQMQSFKPIYVFQDEKTIERDLRHLERRLRHRMVAGKMCLPFLQEAFTGSTPDLPPGINRLFVSQMANMVLDESGNSVPKHVVGRTWKPSLPVIHIAAAVTLVSSEWVRRGLGQLTIGRLVADRDAIESVVQCAEECVPLLAKSPRAHVDVDSLIRIRLAA